MGLVAQTDVFLAGSAAVHTHRHLHHAAPVSTIDVLVVTEQLRSRGVGNALVRAAEDLARRKGSCMLDLDSAPHRVEARRSP